MDMEERCDNEREAPRLESSPRDAARSTTRILVDVAQTAKEMTEALARYVGLSPTRLRLLGMLRRRGEV